MSTPSDTESDPNGDPEGDTAVHYEVSGDERTWGILVHAAAFVGFIIPFGNVLAPLLIWAIKKDESQFVDENGTEAVNFQITWTILLFLSAISILVVVGFVLLPVVALAWLILVVIAILRASDEQVYDYPLTLDLLS